MYCKNKQIKYILKYNDGLKKENIYLKKQLIMFSKKYNTIIYCTFNKHGTKKVNLKFTIMLNRRQLQKKHQIIFPLITRKNIIDKLTYLTIY